MTTESYIRRQRRFTILEPNETKFASHLTLWLLVGTPAEHSLLWRMSLYIFDILFLSPYIFGFFFYFYGLSALVDCWYLAFIRRISYKFFKWVSYWLHSGYWEGLDPMNRFNHTGWVAIVTRTVADRSKSVRNRCEIEVFGCVFVLSHCCLSFSACVGSFVIWLSQISSFFSLVCGLNLHRRPGERFLPKPILVTIFHQIWIKAQSMTWRTFKMFFEACDICNPVPVVWKWFEGF